MRNEGASLQAAELPLDALALDRASGEPMQRQLYAALRDLILRRNLPPGLRLPSTRALARDIGVSRNTVMAAYEQLASEGYIETRQGSRTYVVDLPISPSSTVTEGMVRMEGHLARSGRTMRSNRPVSTFASHLGLRPSAPDVRHFPFKTWSRLMNKSLHFNGDELFTYNHIVGYPPLQTAIANYVQAYRGVRCEPRQIVITNGAQGALDLIARLLLDVNDLVWMEEPGYHGAQGAFLAAGARLAPLHVDASGWQLGKIPDEPVRLIYTSPSCQQPLGQTMLMEQRLRLLEIARQQDAWVIEDDFDSEYRMSGTSVPAMQGGDTTGRTIYIGTFAKTLFPALRIGFMVLPEPISSDIAQAIFVSGHFVGLPMQSTLSDFIEQGHFARHLRRMRRLYSTRRAVFLALVEKHLGAWIEPFESDVGIQITFRLKVDLDDTLVARLANERQLNVTPLSIHYLGTERLRGFVLGYAALERRTMEQLLVDFAGVFRSLTEGSGGTCTTHASPIQHLN